MDNPVREIRKANGMTQAQLADKIGCSLPTVKRLEAEGKMPRGRAVKRILEALATVGGVEIETGEKVTA